MFSAAGQGTHDDQVKDDERIRAPVVMDVERLGHEAQVFGVNALQCTCLSGAEGIGRTK